jgi:hypothetical protein
LSEWIYFDGFQNCEGKQAKCSSHLWLLLLGYQQWLRSERIFISNTSHISRVSVEQIIVNVAEDLRRLSFWRFENEKLGKLPR